MSGMMKKFEADMNDTAANDELLKELGGSIHDDNENEEDKLLNQIAAEGSASEELDDEALLGDLDAGITQEKINDAKAIKAQMDADNSKTRQLMRDGKKEEA